MSNRWPKPKDDLCDGVGKPRSGREPASKPVQCCPDVFPKTPKRVTTDQIFVLSPPSTTVPLDECVGSGVEGVQQGRWYWSWMGIPKLKLNGKVGWNNGERRWNDGDLTQEDEWYKKMKAFLKEKKKMNDT